MSNKIVNATKYSPLANPVVGNALTALAGIVFLFLCMIFPLVGPAAVHGSGSPGAGPAPHLKLNYMAFSGVLALALILAVAAVVSKIERRKVDGSPLPFYSIALVMVLVAIVIVFALGLLSL
jgi:hypothetical protein